jgi:anhydro-N-acetylmuramic acid kinase
MVYRAIGLMSGSSLDGLDIVFAELEESAGKWHYTIHAADCYAYDDYWQQQLQNVVNLPAYEYLLLHSAYGKYLGEQVNRFIEQYDLYHKIQIIASHGHTVFHAPKHGMTAQLGDGATIAATTGINVVSDLRAMDVALGGQGAPIVPIGEKLLLHDYTYFLNIGGIANVTVSDHADKFIAFDVCAANKVLNMLAGLGGKSCDENGDMARAGKVNTPLLTALNQLEYYQLAHPKSLDNSFGIHTVFPLIQSFNLPVNDALCTYTEHIVQQIVYAINNCKLQSIHHKLLVTGGGAFNTFLVERLTNALAPFNIAVTVPDDKLVQYKEALVMALLGILRWREENTVLDTVTGAVRSSIGGAVWIGQEA